MDHRRNNYKETFDLDIEIVYHNNYATATSMIFVNKEADCGLKFNTVLKNEREYKFIMTSVSMTRPETK